MKKIRIVLFVMFFGTLSTVLQAQQGTEGKDYARETIRLEGSAMVTVTASNYSKAEHNGNKARVVLTVNGASKGDSGLVDSERAQASFTIDQPGTYHLLAVCSTELARQESCSITVEQEKVRTFR